MLDPLVQLNLVRLLSSCSRAASDWWIPYGEVYSGDDAVDEPQSAVPHFATGDWVFAEHAKRRLEMVLSPSGEFLPIRVRDRMYFLYHCVEELSVLDEAKSHLIRSQPGNVLVGVEEIALNHKEPLPAIFRVSGLWTSMLFCNAEVAAEIARAVGGEVSTSQVRVLLDA